MNNVTTPPTKPVKAKAEKKEPTVRRSKFAEIYPEDAALKVEVKENPKKKGSASNERFEGYFKSTTVGAALANGLTYQDIAYDVGRQFITVSKKAA
ncbi:MAG: hypothetical protein DRI24_23605 [Deltaproteobacteria bacterium]|nr:MAG: hypothetical protein DRI24_23605 [Deltaproteobacteria bacterium]